MHVDDIQLAGKTENIEPTWKILMKDVDLGEPTSSLDHENLGCTQRQCAIKNGDLMQKSYLLGPTTWKVMEKCVEKYCELANKTTQQLFKVATTCVDDHQFKEEENGSVGELSTVCSQIVLKCLYLARIGRPDILWSVNKLARAVTKWTKDCDRRFARLISYIHHTSEYPQYVMWETQRNNADLDFSQGYHFAGDLEDSKSTSGRSSVQFRKSHVCANKLDVQETDFSFTQLYRSGDHFSGCRFTHGWYSLSHTLRFGH